MIFPPKILQFSHYVLVVGCVLQQDINRGSHSTFLVRPNPNHTQNVSLEESLLLGWGMAVWQPLPSLSQGWKARGMVTTMACVNGWEG